MRTNTVLRGIGVVVGLALIASAFVLAYVITPDYVKRLPDDTDVTRSYTGTFRTLVDAQEVAKGNIAAAIKRDVPMAVERTVKTEKTSGNKALVSDSRTTTAAATRSRRRIGITPSTARRSRPPPAIRRTGR